MFSWGLLQKVFKVIADAWNSSVDIDMQRPRYRYFPFDRAYPWQNKYIEEVLRRDKSFIDLPTGTGKTAIYATAAVESGLKTMIITPRNALQDQVADLEKNMNFPFVVLKGREKHCNKLIGGKVPCTRRWKSGRKWYFRLAGRVVEYPCEDCPYEKRRRLLRELFESGECVAVMNQGNFWMLRSKAEFVIVDEADETLRSVSEKVGYKGVVDSDNPKEILEWMRDKVEEDLKVVEKALEVERNSDKLEKLNSRRESLLRKLRKIEFFMNYDDDKLIAYRDRSKVYVEIFDDTLSVADRLFGDSKLCLVTATPPLGHSPSGDEIPFRAKIIYVPIGNMSRTNIERRKNYHLLEEAAEFAMKVYDFVVKISGMRKAPIHCGNLSLHGVRIYKHLSLNGRRVLLMEEGKQEQYIKQFVDGDYDFLCGVAMEYGYDFDFSPVQFIVKVPYADITDPRIVAIRKMLGEEKFDEWYCWDAMSRIIQAAGRNARSPNDFGVTLILDSQFWPLYQRFRDRIPRWFRDRLVVVGDAGAEGSASVGEGGLEEVQTEA